jgi:hypothetical protein
MEYIEYLRSESVRLNNELDEARVRLNRMFDLPYRGLVKDLSHLPEQERSKMLRAIEDARSRAWDRMGKLITEVEVLRAAVDDAIDKTGRLV